MNHHKGRGAVSTPAGRFAKEQTTYDPEEQARIDNNAPKTTLRATQANRIISRNSSPDIPFDRSINPYQGCEHGCIYCYARPSHSYLDLSPGLDFETQIFYKANSVALLLAQWHKERYECKPITIGANTDPYQPAEKSLQLTRQLLALFHQYKHPVNIITKSHLITRDIDLLSDLAEQGLCSVAMSMPTMDAGLKRIMEARVPNAASRLQAMTSLTDKKIPVSLLLAPVIPAINDNEIETIIGAAAAAGASRAHYVFLRLPHELKQLFADWLQTHFPDRAEHVMSLVRQASGGKKYDHRFGKRQSGQGPYAKMLASRFQNACQKHRLNAGTYQQALDCSIFSRPDGGQMALQF